MKSSEARKGKDLAPHLYLASATQSLAVLTELRSAHTESEKKKPTQKKTRSWWNQAILRLGCPKRATWWAQALGSSTRPAPSGAARGSPRPPQAWLGHSAGRWSRCLMPGASSFLKKCKCKRSSVMQMFNLLAKVSIGTTKHAAQHGEARNGSVKFPFYWRNSSIRASRA